VLARKYVLFGDVPDGVVARGLHVAPVLVHEGPALDDGEETLERDGEEVPFVPPGCTPLAVAWIIDGVPAARPPADHKQTTERRFRPRHSAQQRATCTGPDQE
jgi:hypothetical protein